MGFYLAAIDKAMKEPNHNRTIGIILRRTQDRLTVEYALEYISEPIGVSTYLTKITEVLPKRLKSSLHTVQEIEAELEKDIKNDK